MVLFFIMVLALLGDNPMQSKLACHIGLKGKFFCRVCLVKGRDAKAIRGAGDRDGGGGAAEDTDSVCSALSEASEASEAASPRERSSGNDRRKKSKRVARPETMAETVDRVRAFVQLGRPREKSDTLRKIKEIFTCAMTIGKKTASERLKTAYGIKDNYQEIGRAHV